MTGNYTEPDSPAQPPQAATADPCAGVMGECSPGDTAAHGARAAAQAGTGARARAGLRGPGGSREPGSREVGGSRSGTGYGARRRSSRLHGPP